MKSWLKEHFEEKIDFWSPRSGSAFIFSKEIPTGQVIEVGQRMQEKVTGVKNMSNEEKVKEAAFAIRQEIFASSNTFSTWPPTEDELLNVNTVIPNLLNAFLMALLSKRKELSKRKKLRISSIAQDIIYSVKNGKDRTMKQVLLSLCTKRKTGLKQLVRWLNKFGHSISYDEVSYLETSLANQQAEQQIHKSFVPAIIKPSRFVTFVWDNNDINPETLTGISMHCTNGILIQLAAESHRNNDWIISQNPTPSPTVRKRSFKAMFNAIDLLVSKRRECPDTINIELQPARNSEGEQASKNTDFTWLETVKELLLQSKLKAEKLGLQGTDVVLDLAIYAKAVEILMMPQHLELRNFIILRMGAFHTSCIFLAVIGKRFGDAGLRDIIIEANLLGEASINKFLHGKHYNNCMRIYKYLFDA
eukprot:gene21368-23448_t